MIVMTIFNELTIANEDHLDPFILGYLHDMCAATAIQNAVRGSTSVDVVGCTGLVHGDGGWKKLEAVYG